MQANAVPGRRSGKHCKVLVVSDAVAQTLVQDSEQTPFRVTPG